MNHHPDTIYRIALKLIPNLGDQRLKSILEVFGSAKEFFGLNRKDLGSAPSIRPEIRDAVINKSTLERAEQELNFCDKYNIHIVHIDDKRYPQRLKRCNDAPALLFVKGQRDQPLINLNPTKAIAIVGTRRHSNYGKKMTEQLVEGLKAHNATIISGLAKGIDGIAHRAALEHNLSTFGVLGHGLDRIYPEDHRLMAKQMLDHGALISELVSGTIPEGSNFPMRNRIVAGMVDGLVVVESQIQGGSMITARLGLGYNREVMTFPGRVNDKFSRGCNWLIKSNNASCIEGINDLEYVMNWKISETQLQLNLTYTAQEEELLNAFTEPIMSPNQLHRATQQPVHSVNTTLLGLELKGVLRSLPAQRYERLIW